MTKPETVDMHCPKCGRWLTEVGNYGRGKCCGYEIEITLVRRQALTTPTPKPQTTRDTASAPTLTAQT